MAANYESDEDKYANESFETESDTENIPEQDEDSSDDGQGDGNRLTPFLAANGSFFALYGQNTNMNVGKMTQRIAGGGGGSGGGGTGSAMYRHRRDYATYHSSSDDESDVIISKTIAEINTAPMRMEDAGLTTPTTPAKTPMRTPIRSAMKTPTKPPRHINTNFMMMHANPTETTSASELSETANESDSDDENFNANTVIEQAAVTTMETNVATSSENEDSESEGSDEESEVDNENDGISTNEQGSQCDTQSENNSEANSAMNSDAPEPDNDDEENENFEAVASTHTFTQSNSHTKLTNDLDKPTEFTEKTVYEASSDTNLHDICEPTMEVRLSSNTPTSFNSDEYPLHMNLIPQGVQDSKMRIKPTNRRSWTFTNVQMREIDRQNKILLKKILSQKPTYNLNPPKKTNKNDKPVQPTSSRTTSAAINRKKQQRQIDLDNLVLKRKIEAISLRRPVL